MHGSISTWMAAGAVMAMAFAGPVQAQQPQALKRALLQSFDVPGSDYETVIGTSELGPNAVTGRQSHPGPEGGYVVQGRGTIVVDGRPPLALKAGQSYKLAPGAWHTVRSGPNGVKLVVVWVVRKGEPLDTPTP
ncbi:MAG: cupin domain-containing protein [Caulobacteraceae bacterium]|nr:cupin domain-containing protein [Caulobacteraceae bacterium]